MIDANTPGLPQRDEIESILELVLKEAGEYLRSVDARPVRSQSAEATAHSFIAPFPEKGHGAFDTVRELLVRGTDAAHHTAGSRSYHFVLGGTTPAALGADLWATVLDQIGYSWICSPLSAQLELVSVDWLKDLFGLSASWGGVITTGATMANYIGLAAARQWWGQKHGVDVSAAGLYSLPRMPVLSSGFLHSSSTKALSMLGLGRESAQRFSRDACGRIDIKALEKALQDLDGEPAVIIGNAGEVNAGEFDPINDLADLAEQYGAWLHVDGAFGLFARVSPRTQHLVAGIERAHSITVDGHKWLNVPYDCGFSLLREPAALGGTFAYYADYLPKADDPRPTFGERCPESSRRARSLSVWATLRAYGRKGVRAMIERHLDLAQHLAKRIDAAPDLERLAEVGLNIVSFRYHPAGVDDEATLNDVNDRLAEALLQDGRYLVGGTKFGTQSALRPALVNWRIRAEDLDDFAKVVSEVGAQVLATV